MTTSRWLMIAAFLIALIWYGELVYNLARPTLVSYAPVIAKQESLPQSYVRIPSLGILAPMTVAAQTNPMENKDWSVIRTALTKGVALSYTTPAFAETGLAFVTGHSSDGYPHAYASVFAPLGQIKEGDTFEVKVDDIVYEYTVIKKDVFAPTDIQRFTQLAPADTTKQRVALVTCWPVLTTRNRLVVLGERIK
jgi:LPXTG-site transpeptidase (sortase) family protein